MPIQNVRGVELAYEVHGTGGDPAVLVHGSLVDRHTWDLVVPGFAHSMEIVTYDRRGHGESALLPRPHPVRDDASDLAGLLEALDLYPVHVIAHSYGGAVALRLAIDRPEMVRSVAIHEAPFVGLLADDPATAAEGARLLGDAQKLHALVRSGQGSLAAEQLVGVFSKEPGAWGRIPVEMQRTFARTIERWSEEFGDPEAYTPDRDACRELMIPALLTEGSLSPGFLQRIARDLGRLLPNSQVVELRDVGHTPHRIRPDQYLGVLLTFLLERDVPTS